MSTRSSPLSDAPEKMSRSATPPAIQVKKEVAEQRAVTDLADAEGDKATPVTTSTNMAANTSVPATAQETFDTPMAEASATDEADPASIPSTPASGKRVANGSAGEASPVKKYKGKDNSAPTTPFRQRKAPSKTPSAAKAIASSIDELSAEDRMLIRMKDEGKNWKEIGEKWTELTGVVPAKSTLPNRYARLRANIMTMSQADQQNLVKAKNLVEEEFAREKWEKIQQKMMELGTKDSFPTAVLQKQLLKMEQAQAAPATDPFEDVAE